MKTAIAMKEMTMESRIDRHFGKCDSFLIFDGVTGKSEIIENPGKSLQGCKADIIVNMLVEKKVSRIISGDFGSNVQQLLNKHQIQMIIYPDNTLTVSEIIALLTNKIK